MHRMRPVGKVFARFFARKSHAPLCAAVAAAMVVWLLTAPAALAEPPLQGVFAENFSLMEKPVATPPSELRRLDGTKATIADFRGEIVLLNFWATWCAPCLREMPSLERLQTALADRPFRVVAVSTDRAGGSAVKPFLSRLELEEITILLDIQPQLASAMGLRGLPTTYLVDAEGRVIGGMEGPAEWDSPDARALIEYYLDDLDPPQRASR